MGDGPRPPEAERAGDDDEDAEEERRPLRVVRVDEHRHDDDRRVRGVAEARAPEARDGDGGDRDEADERRDPAGTEVRIERREGERQRQSGPPRPVDGALETWRVDEWPDRLHGEILSGAPPPHTPRRSDRYSPH